MKKNIKRDIDLKKESERLNLKSHRVKESISLDDLKDGHAKDEDEDEDTDEVIIKSPTVRKEEPVVQKPVQPKKEELVIERKVEEPKIIGKIDLDSKPHQEKKKEQPVPEKPIEEVKLVADQKKQTEEKIETQIPANEEKIIKPSSDAEYETPKEPEMVTTNIPKRGRSKSRW